jgi:copper chaperone CopZ
MEKKKFQIPNITCNHCVMTIQNELSEKEGISSVSGDAGSKNVTVEWQPPASEDFIRKVLKEINYPAE